MRLASGRNWKLENPNHSRSLGLDQGRGTANRSQSSERKKLDECDGGVGGTMATLNYWATEEGNEAKRAMAASEPREDGGGRDDPSVWTLGRTDGRLGLGAAGGESFPSLGLILRSKSPVSALKISTF